MLARRVAPLGLVIIMAVALAAPAQARAGRSADEDQVAAAIVEYLNGERATRGLAPLSWVSDFYAQDRADEQPNGGTDGHAGFSASAAASAMGLEGARTTAETIYWGGVLGAGDAVRNWMESSAHRDLLMHPQMTHLSVGVSCRTDSLHAVAHVGVEEMVSVSRTPANPVVTSSSGPTCDDAATPAEPEPRPEPEPEPPAPLAPNPPAPDPEPEPAATEEVDARPAVPEQRAMFHLGNVVFVEQPPPTPPPRPRPSRESVLAAPVPDLPAPVSRPSAPVIVGIGLLALQGLALASRPWRWRTES